MNNLKSCPFCGGVAKLNAPSYEHYSPCWFKCTQCGAEGPTKASELEAQEAWNRRTQERFDRWISVKDKKRPLLGSLVIVCLQDEKTQRVRMSYYDKYKGIEIWSDMPVGFEVTHWAPLPEPPKEEKPECD